MKKKKNNFNKAFTLVETLVAISIFTMSILALFSVLASGISNTGYAKKKMVASYLAQEGIECIRNTRDNYVLYPNPPNQTWLAFKTMSPINFNNITCPATSDGFTRILSKDIGGPGPDKVKIYSKVSWTQGSGEYSITFSEDLYNWVE